MIEAFESTQFDIVIAVHFVPRRNVSVTHEHQHDPRQINCSLVARGVKRQAGQGGAQHTQLQPFCLLLKNIVW
jgi:hypothetical protein